MAQSGPAPMFGRCLIIFIWLAFFCIAITQGQSGCGGSKSTSSGILTSPGYPANVTSITDRQNPFRACWPPNTYYYTECVWTITIPDQHKFVELTITDMEFTQNECCRNYIEVRDGLTTRDPVLAGPCGTGSFPPILSSGNKLRVVLRSSSATSGHKFQASWKTACRRTFTSEHGQLQSPGYPGQYPSGNTCTYLIEQPRGFQIQIQFSQFRLDDADSSGNCLDFLEIYDRPTDIYPKLGTSPRFCGSTSPSLLTSTRNQIFIKFYSDSRTSTGSIGFSANFSRKAPECTRWTNLPDSGVITSPGFPNPFPLAASCTWEITIPRGSLMDFTFHTIALGPDNEDLLDCGDIRVKTVVSLYEVAIGDTEKLLARYCRRNVFSNVITTSPFQRKLKVVFESKNLDSSSVLSSPQINGFNASYISRVFSGNAQDDETKLLAYGPFSNDVKLTKLGSGPIAVPMEPHVQVGHKRYKYALIFQDGKLAFASDTYTYIPTAQPRCSSRRYQNMCPYCASINCSSHNDAAIYYNKHQIGDTISEKNIFPDVNANVRRFKGTDDFNASTVLVVTWEKVQQKNGTRELYVGNATFQVAVAVSKTEAYGLIFYKKNEMKWQVPQGRPTIDVGVTTTNDGKPQCQDFVLSRTKAVLYMDQIQGNIGKEGAWVYKLGEMAASAEQACLNWYYKNDGLKDQRKVVFNLLPKCPCVKSYTNRMEAFGIWVSDTNRYGLQDGKRMYCYHLTRAASQKFYPFGKECCYKYDRSEPNNRIHLLVQDKPDAATATAYNPFFPETYRQYVQEDKMAYDDCCLKSNSSLCDKFYELRPVGDCESDPPFVFAWLCCDPYIVTLDEGGYTFNGWGEYTMVTASSPVAFTLQARTDLVETESGKLSTATVFTAFGAEENRIRVFFGLDPNTNNSLVIYAKGEDFSRRFQNDSAFQVDTDGFFLRRNNDSAELSFPSGVSLRVSVRVKSLMMSLSLPKTFRNKTRGLLGNFNGIKTDDFILPNGTSLSPYLTERQIFQTFGPAWAVTTDSSVMRYEEREGPLNYSHPEFVPLFFDEQSETIQTDAKAKCGDNLACQYDFFATDSEAFALDSKSVKEEADMTNEALNNSVPLLKVPSTLNVPARQVHTFRITGTDVDGDSLTYHVEDDGNGRVQVDSVTGDVTFTPTDTPIEMRFYARDSRNAKSPPQSVEVFVCSGCNGNGICDYSSTVSREGEAQSYLFHRAECVCRPGWEGDDCETPRDDCADNPCMEGQNCTNLTPEEQGNSVIGFKCGECPVGFTNWTSDVECHDVDECDDVPKVCEMTCVNTYGSFECGCQAGYRLENDGRSCVDINECQEKTSNCQQLCNNTVGGYTCGCEAGYNLDNSTRNTCKQTEEFISACRYSDCTQGCKPGIDPATNEPALQCFCFAGFDNITEDGSECRNHDECQDSVSPCSQRCYDYDGGFSCSCYDGYYLAEDTTTCLPCTDGTYGPSCLYQCRCSGQGVDCDNVKGCVCKNGWRGGQCQDDIDECTDNPNRCMSDEECLNTPGSYTCRCLSGFEKNSRTGACTDVDECSDLSVLNTCGERQYCSNVPGSFYCTCMQGYKLFNGQCEDIDECSLGISDCEHQCTNLQGSYNCECRYGYRLNTDRATCSEVSDVCAAEENLSCDHGCTLNDEDRAVCFCKVGFLLNADKQTCTRTSTCITFNCSHACTTINDQPVCSCPPGKILNLDLKTCQDCPQGTFGVACANNCSCGLGALECNATTGCVCKNGWRGERCDRDLNECDVTSVSLQCQNKGATCENTRGSYRCACLNGFEMDDTGMCQDINECRDDRCGQQCENSPGSYRCLCSRGFSLDTDRSSCKDIDECALSATNRCTQTCINLHGNYRCACRPGFVLSADGVSCTISAACNRTDCPKEKGGCSDEQCFCDSGYELSGSNACEAIRTNWCSVPVCEQECQEISNGSTPFLCSCRDGYILNDDKRTCREKDVASGCSRTDCPKENGGCSEEQCFCNAGYRLSDDNMCQPTVGACDRTDCPTENGGCRMEQCFCDSGYELSESNTCQAKEPEKINVAFTVGVQLTIQASELNNKESSTYLSLSQEVSQELKKKLGPVGGGIVDIRVTSLRIGSLIVDADVLVDKVNFPDAMSSLAGQLQLLRKDKFVVQGQSGDVTQMAIKGTEVGSSWTSCQVLQTISPCSGDQSCDESGERPVCRSKDEETPGYSKLAIGLGAGIGTLALIGVAVVCYCCKKGKGSGIADDNRYVRPDSLPSKSPTTASENPYDEPQFYNQAYQADNLRDYGLQEGNYSRLDAACENQPYDRLQPRPESASSIGFAFGPDSPGKRIDELPMKIN